MLVRGALMTDVMKIQASTPEWQFAHLMPHTDFSEPIEYGPLSLVPHNDQRLIKLADSSKAVNKLLTSFTDQFGVREQPSAILVRSNALPKIDSYAIACFRNAIAISSIIEGTAMQLAGGTAGYPLWSDSFDLYAFGIMTWKGV